MSAPWYAIQVRGTSEPTVTDALEAAGIESYYPHIIRKRKWSDRWKDRQIPVFPGYIFSRLLPVQRATVLATSGVFQIVSLGNEPTPIPDAQIESVRILVASGSPLLYDATDVAVGQQVIVTRGLFKGTAGLLVKEKSGGNRLVVKIDALNTTLSVEVDRIAVKRAA